jgi:hypothetical protein
LAWGNQKEVSPIVSAPHNASACCLRERTPDERNGLAAGLGGDEAAAQAMTSFVAVRRPALQPGGTDDNQKQQCRCKVQAAIDP